MYQSDLQMLCDTSIKPLLLVKMEIRQRAPEERDTLWLESRGMLGVFAAGTLIDTPHGRVKIEDLSSGDEVLGLQNGRIAVQSCIALPDHCLPENVLRIRSGYLNAADDLITLPQQLARIDHWLAAALFGTKFPFVAAGRVCLDTKIELEPKTGTQFYRLYLGVCDAITANGVLCITNAMNPRDENNMQASRTNLEYRELTPDETTQALQAGSFFRKSEKNK